MKRSTRSDLTDLTAIILVILLWIVLSAVSLGFTVFVVVWVLRAMGVLS